MTSRDEALGRHLEALQRLSRDTQLRGAGPCAAVREACKVASEVLDVARVSVWLYTDERAGLHNVVVYERDRGHHKLDDRRLASACPGYFGALASERTIAVEDARADPLTRELVDYLEVHGVGALLDAPILIAGDSVGVVCHEHVGEGREFDALARLFAGSIADFVGLAFQTEQLDRRRAELEQTLKAARMGVWTWDIGDNEVQWNEAVGPLFGKPRGWAPTNYEEYISLIHPEDRAELERAIRTALEPGNTGYQVQHRHVLDDGSLRWIEGRGEVEHDAVGRPVRMRGTVMDITERRSLEQRLLQAQKMEAVGRLAGGVAHDFNNLLTAISGTADLIRMDLEGSDQIRADLEQILDAASRGGALTQQLLTFAQRQPTKPVSVDLNRLVVRFDPLLRRVVGANVELRTALGEGSLVTRIDPAQFEQVLMSLAANARDAMAAGGTLTIRTEAAGAGWLRVVLADTGEGMSAEVQRKAFDPFFTTKPPGQGSGLGLAICYTIVDQAGGSMRLDSAPGRGTEVTLTLPRVDVEVAADEEAPPARAARGRGEIVLLVEDEPMVRNLARRALEKHGYAPLCAANAEEALALAQAHAGPVDLLVTDVVMPGGSGAELAATLRAQGHVGTVLMMSGYTFDHLDPELPPDTHFLAKPFTASELVARVRALLS